MTTNEARAAALIEAMIEHDVEILAADPADTGDRTHGPGAIVKALAEAGLLAPELTTLAGQLHAGHIGMTLRGIDARGREVHAELRQVSHTSSETFINTNPLDFDTLRDGCGAMDEWLLNANEQVTLDGLPDLNLDTSEGTSHA